MPLINNPVLFTVDEQRIIDGHPPIKNSDWYKAIFDGIRDKIRTEMMREQNEICAYCGFIIFDSTCKERVEHIVPTSLHVNFMFEPRNLCASCHECNFIKLATETLVDPSLLNYPSSGNGFLIIHPHFDNWDDHIDLEHGLFVNIKNNSDKGKTTIKMCKLNRESLYENRAKILIMQGQTQIKKDVMGLIIKDDPRITDRLLRIISE